MVFKNKRRARALGVAILLVTVLFFLPVSCDTGNDASTIPVEGTWQLETPAYDSVERWTITASEIHYESSYDAGETFSTTYRVSIVSYSDVGLNGGDTSLTSGGADAIDSGYAVIEYTEVNGAGTGEVGKFNVFRWATNASDTGARDFTQGYLATDLAAEDYTNVVFDTADEAESGATNANGYFSFASVGATLVQ